MGEEQRRRRTQHLEHINLILNMFLILYLKGIVDSSAMHTQIKCKLSIKYVIADMLESSMLTLSQVYQVPYIRGRRSILGSIIFEYFKLTSNEICWQL